MGDGNWRAFLEGFAFGGAFTVKMPPMKPPGEALADDWRKVGDDMRRVMAAPSIHQPTDS